MKKWQIEISKRSRTSEISQKLFLVFLFPSFPRLPRFLIFRTGRFLSKNCFLADLVGSDLHISLPLKIVSMWYKVDVLKNLCDRRGVRVSFSLKWRRDTRTLLQNYYCFAVLLGGYYLFGILHISSSVKTSKN